MNKEEILFKNLIGINKDSINKHHDFLPSVKKAMQEYVDQETKELKERLDYYRDLKYKEQMILQSLQTTVKLQAERILELKGEIEIAYGQGFWEGEQNGYGIAKGGR